MKNLEEVKAHLKRNKRKYIVAGAVVGSGTALAGAYILGTKTVPRELETLTKIEPKISQSGFVWKSPPTINITVEALGDPGNIIQDVTTGTIYASQRQAADALGVYPSRVSEHLKGAREHIDGHKLINLGKAHVLGEK